MNLPAAPRRSGPPNRPQRVFTVERVERLTPHLVRLHLGGPGFEKFLAGAKPENLAKTDKYVKLLLAKPHLGLVPPYDLDALRAFLAPDDMPVRRTYTVRSVDEVSQTIAVDFVVHGDEGVAGPWAARATPGDVVALSGPGGQYAPSPETDVEHLLVGDDSALPAIAAALESLPEGARGRAIVEVVGAADELPLVHPDGVSVTWLHRSASSAPAGKQLVDTVTALKRPEGRVQVFAHGESSAMKELGVFFRERWGLEKPDLSLSPYWAFGRDESRFQAEKRRERLNDVPHGSSRV